jgi:hypothetical protein
LLHSSFVKDTENHHGIIVPFTALYLSAITTENIKISGKQDEILYKNGKTNQTRQGTKK